MCEAETFHEKFLGNEKRCFVSKLLLFIHIETKDIEYWLKQKVETWKHEMIDYIF